ncbi:MAG: retroviral-like aspartic protease family protein [Defluviitaleaceae bacterium]|nr:retroviral-like aspartic protease family protein [Defluviitaleaceae bacterium]
MSNFSAKLNSKRPCRYVFEANLWDKKRSRFGAPVNVLVDTGAFNTIIHKFLVPKYGRMLEQTIMTSVGGYKGGANICILDKINIGGHILENVVALAIPFEGELQDHILLGANTTNNWDFSLSRKRNIIEAKEELSDEAMKREFPYQYCYNNKGQVMALQEMVGDE